jgi:hypothetical protein
MGILIPAVLVLVSPSDVTAVTSEDGAAHPNSVGSVAWRCGTMIAATLACQWPCKWAMTTCIREKSCVEWGVAEYRSTVQKPVRTQTDTAEGALLCNGIEASAMCMACG